jgi:hypothetical protein
MTDAVDNDDSWADLCKELGVSGSKQTPATPPSAPPLSSFTESFDDATDSEEYVDDSEESSEEGDDGSSPLDGDAEPGTKKRRRRRRRRKKKSPGEAVSEVDGVVATERSESDAEDAVENTTSCVEESVPSDLADPHRDVITNWNVPSWSDIVAGLYRPEGGVR